MICRFIDTHCHFDFPPFSGDEEASLQRAAQAGVGKIIVPATEAENFARVQALAEKYQPLYAALGLHPGMLEKHSDVSLDQLQQALERRPAKVVAVGEIGLDLFGDDPQFERQQWLLDEQLKLAKRYDLPVILHSRRTHDKLAMHLKRHDLSRTGVVHGFSGSLQQAERFVQLGYKIGVGGTITYPRASKPAMSSQNYRWHRCCWKPTRRICRSTAFRGSLTARNRLHGCLTCFASCARNQKMRLPKCCLIIRMRCLAFVGSLPFVGSIRQSAHNA